jgi:hypothetical protein
MWGLPPTPGPALERAHDGGGGPPPPDSPVPQACSLCYRPREYPDAPGIGQWLDRWFPDEPARGMFVTRWQHDFEMKLRELSDHAEPHV